MDTIRDRPRRPQVFRTVPLLLALALGACPDAHGGPAAPRGEAPAELAAPAHPPPRVLVLFSGSRLLSANVLFDESLRHSLASSGSESIECFGEFLDEMRFPARHRERMLDLLRDKYGGRPPGVVVAFAPASLEFCLRHRSQIFSEVPIIFAGMDTTLGADAFTSGVTGVRSIFDGPATLRTALNLHPRTKRVFVISTGIGPDSTGFESAHLRAADVPVPLSTLRARPRSRLLEELSRLPPHSLVIDFSAFGGNADSLAPRREAMQRMSEVSNAPIYGVTDPLVEHGLVGAVTTPMDSLGSATAAMVLRVLSRENNDVLPSVQDLAASPVFDWRQLRRWGLRKSDLPPGSIVRFQPPSFWRQHVLLVVTTGALFLLQSGLILALVLQSRRRQRAELEARKRREELAHMTRVATMGELTASLAHEINQPLTAILSNAQAAQRLLDAGGGQMEEIRDILTDIAADDQRAGEVIRRMRTLLRKGESNPTEVDVNELVEEVVGLVGAEMILQNVSFAFELSVKPRKVHGDRVQLQQVLLNLMVNALDAMKETPSGNRRIVVRTAPAGPRSIEVSVHDTGIGIPEDKVERIFEPFVTTKPHGMGLGLAICRSIIQAHGGHIGSRKNVDRGTTFWFTLPTVDGAKP